MTVSTTLHPVTSDCKAGKGLPGHLHFREAGECQAPECDRIVPGGMVSDKQEWRYCSQLCRSRLFHSRHGIGTCELCGGPITGYSSPRRKPRFCKRAHEKAFHEERLMGPTGEFRPILSNYLATTTRYRPRALEDARLSLAHFFSFVVELGITRLVDVRPSVVSRWIKRERDRGITRSGFVGHISTFFLSMIAEELVDMSSPVISRIHSQTSAPTEPRPFTKEEVSLLWDLLIEYGDLVLLAAFSIGLECGLRVGEVCNIRVSDIDFQHQRIFVRLPTKNMATRTVPFGNKVALYAQLWLKQRRENSRYDHLIIGDRGGRYESADLDGRFRRFFQQHLEALAIFKFHRCRHTWASGLLNCGMNIAVLQKLGGWKHLGSMQKYLRILPETIRREYQAAYQKMQEQVEENRDEIMSLIDFMQTPGE